MRRILVFILIFQLIGLGCPPFVVWADLAATSTLETVDSGTTDELAEAGVLADDERFTEAEVDGNLDGVGGGFNDNGKNFPEDVDEPPAAEIIGDKKTGDGITEEVDGAANPAEETETANSGELAEYANATSTIDRAEGELDAALTIIEDEGGLSAPLGAPPPEEAPVETETATTTAEIESSPTRAAPAVLEQFIVDDQRNVTERVEASGRYGVDSGFKLCAVIGNTNGQDDLEVYGQIFYPRRVGFGTNDIRGRVGCGQILGAVCRLVLQEQDGGDLLPEAAPLYCCDRKLAYDDVAGTYETLVIARDMNGDYSNAVAGVFDFVSKTAFELDFAAVDYGTVAADVETGAQSNGDNLKTRVRNTGNTRLTINISQDDMGLADENGNSLVFYRAQFAGEEAAVYGAGAAADLPGVLDLSAAMILDFAVLVSRYPETEGRPAAAYRGKMNITAVNAGNYECLSYALGETVPAETGGVLVADGGWDVLEIKIKDESGREAFENSSNQ